MPMTRAKIARVEEDGEGTGSWKVVAIEGLAETVIVGAWTRGKV